MSVHHYAPDSKTVAKQKMEMLPSIHKQNLKPRSGKIFLFKDPSKKFQVWLCTIYGCLDRKKHATLTILFVFLYTLLLAQVTQQISDPIYKTSYDDLRKILGKWPSLQRYGKKVITKMLIFETSQQNLRKKVGKNKWLPLSYLKIIT